MSKQNHEITTPSLLFKNIRVVGISITVFLSTADKRAVQELYDHVQVSDFMKFLRQTIF